jgi:hypothetical protein
VSRADEEEPLLPDEQVTELLTALQAALRPGELDAALNERLIELAIEDPLAPASAAELAESERLRDALDRGAPHEDTATLAALRAAFEAPAASEPRIDSSVDQAVDVALRSAPVAAPLPTKRRGNVVYAVFGAASAALAAAALLMLFVGTASRSASQAALASDFAKPRSTAPLFNERFETAETTARIDAIASARSRDLRDNRYAAWGVR